MNLGVDQKRKRWWSLILLANHYPPLHGLRVIAVVLVVELHSSLMFGDLGLFTTRSLDSWPPRLWFGMDCFFILSGFLIGSLLMKDASGLSPKKLGRFYARRSFRIFPQYYVTLTLLALMIYSPLSASQWATLPYEYLYLTNYASGEKVMPWAWSLAIEEHFYLVVPFLLALLRIIKGNRSRLTLLIGLWVLGFLSRLVSLEYFQLDEIGVYPATHTRADILVAGVFIAYLQRYYGNRLRAIYSRRQVRIIAIGVALCCFAWLVLTPRGIMYALFGYGTVTSLMYVIVITWLLNHGSTMSRFLGQPVFLKLASLSYGIYLIHIPVITAVALPLAPRILDRGIPVSVAYWLCLPVVIVAVVAGSFLMHLVVDKPALLLRDRLVP